MSTTCYGVIIWSVADRRLHASLQFPIRFQFVLRCRLQVSWTCQSPSFNATCQLPSDGCALRRGSQFSLPRFTPTHTYPPVGRVLRWRSQVSLPRFTPTHLSVACFVAVSRSLSLVSHLPACRSWAPLPSPGLSPSFHTYPPVGRMLRCRSQVSLLRVTPTHLSVADRRLRASGSFSGLSPSCHTYLPTRSRLQRWQPTTAVPLPLPLPPSSLPTLPTSSPQHSWQSSGR